MGEQRRQDVVGSSVGPAVTVEVAGENPGAGVVTAGRDVEHRFGGVRNRDRYPVVRSRRMRSGGVENRGLGGRGLYELHTQLAPRCPLSGIHEVPELAATDDGVDVRASAGEASALR